MRWLLLFLVGCGRIGFDMPTDGRGDAASCSGHDEDGDGVADSCDPCPYLAESDPRDTDSDGVSDACDPNPLVPTENLAFFDPFIADRPEWNYGGAPHSYANDALAVDTRGDFSFIVRDAVVSNDTVGIAGNLVALASTGTIQLTISFFAAGNAHYYCEVFGDATSAKISLTYTFDGMTYTSVKATPLPGFAPGALYLTADHRNGMLYCETAQGSVADVIPSGFNAIERVAIQATGCDLRLRYFAHVHTN
jgi:hypothetical protein